MATCDARDNADQQAERDHMDKSQRRARRLMMRPPLLGVVSCLGGSSVESQSPGELSAGTRHCLGGEANIVLEPRFGWFACLSLCKQYRRFLRRLVRSCHTAVLRLGSGRR